MHADVNIVSGLLVSTPSLLMDDLTRRTAVQREAFCYGKCRSRSSAVGNEIEER